jgi:hypothetical protein
LIFSITVPGQHSNKTATLGVQVALPAPERDKILDITGREATDVEKAAWDKAQEMSISDTMWTMLGELTRARNSFTQTTQELGHQIASALPNEKAVARMQSAQKEKSTAVGLPDTVNGAFDPSDPSYLNTATAVPLVPENTDGDGPTEAF